MMKEATNRGGLIASVSKSHRDFAGEFKDVESGKRADNRPGLEAAFAACRLHRATLIIAKLDRLSRDAHFLLGLQKAKVDFICCDDPHMTPLTLGIRAVVAQHERELISTRTKDALAAARRKGKKLGGRRYKFERDAKGEVVKDAKGKPIYSNVLAEGSAKARAAGTRALQERAAMRAADIAPLQEAGATTLRGHCRCIERTRHPHRAGIRRLVADAGHTCT